ncbi:FemAB family protein [Flavobacterium sp. JP2137]|uniref:FemAB family protein n=1 Tax=Flavobacterium sp. JP2137 TaxID=3414510 RepID=UPI003D2FA27D
MNDFSIVIYDDSHFDLWNDFVATAANSTFLFDRNFMDYHRERFDDFSLMIFDNNSLIAVLPAHRTGAELRSHSGLTYGGLCVGPKTDIMQHRLYWQALLSFLKKRQIDRLTVKVLPVFYACEWVNQFRYLAFQLGGVLSSSELNLCVDYNDYAISKSKLKHDRKSGKYPLQIVEDDDLSAFWQSVLVPLLQERYQTKPVHSLEEISKLQRAFPNKIRQFSVYYQSEIVAGITVFEFEAGVKSQYGAATSLGKELRALDHLFIYLIQKYGAAGKRFFDMGVVSDSSDLGFNAGLLQQKRELGCTTYLQDIIEFEL